MPQDSSAERPTNGLYLYLYEDQEERGQFEDLDINGVMLRLIFKL